MLSLKHITKDYKVASSYVHALKGVDLEFRKSEFVCILGQSGCGKTTLLNIIGGLDHYTEGDLVIQGKSTKDFSDRDWDVYRNHRIGFIFQSYNLIPHQTVLGNVELALTIAGVSREERKERAQRALERVGLGNELGKKPNQLSGGQCQRVAIARALVNEPDILLADEPTGALDSETSVQIMELIKEIAGERLVIMVTHNPELAGEYASRIVKLHDGLVEEDSDPYSPEEERKERQNGESYSSERHESETAQNGKKPKKLRARMSFLTSLALSAKNLLTKKGRTIITSVAGSIGIISVCLVLALSSGFNAYIKRTEEDMLSYYPIEVTESAFDVTSAMMSFTAPKDMPDMDKLEDKVYIDSFLTGLANNIAVTNNISPAYLDYISKADTKSYSAIQYSYGAGLSDSIFTKVTTGRSHDEPTKDQYMSLSRLKEFYISELKEAAPQYTALIPFADFFGNIVNKMPGTESGFMDEGFASYVLSQYDVLGGEKAHFPESANEAVLVVGGNNEATDLTLAQLGLLPEPDFLSLFKLGAEGDENKEEQSENYMTLGFNEVIGKEYVFYGNNAIYAADPEYNANPLLSKAQYPYVYNGQRASLDVGENEGFSVKITAILRLKEGLTYGCLTSGLNITEALVNDFIELNMKSDIVKHVLDNSETHEYKDVEITVYSVPAAENLLSYYDSVTTVKNPATGEEIKNPVTGEPVTVRYTTSNKVLRYLGGLHTPNGLKIYATDFDGKDDLLDYLDGWNELCAAGSEYVYTLNGEDFKIELGESDKITYTDRVGLLMGMMQTMLDVITYVLVAFTAISLVVSSVMIGIITYVSVVERVKEIGVLRSLGARKHDIRNLFNAETFIIGLAAGLIGIAFTYLFSLVINVIIVSLTGIAGIAALPPLTAFIMVCVSVILTLISGLIPAQAAAKKDPVIALRTE